jgi:hypothetical protein
MDTILSWILRSHKLCFLPAACWFIARLVIRLWSWSRHVPPKHWLTFTHLHSINIPKERTLHDSWLVIFIFHLQNLFHSDLYQFSPTLSFPVIQLDVPKAMFCLNVSICRAFGPQQALAKVQAKKNNYKGIEQSNFVWRTNGTEIKIEIISVAYQLPTWT